MELDGEVKAFSFSNLPGLAELGKFFVSGKSICYFLYNNHYKIIFDYF